MGMFDPATDPGPHPPPVEPGVRRLIIVVDIPGKMGGLLDARGVPLSPDEAIAFIEAMSVQTQAITDILDLRRFADEVEVDVDAAAAARDLAHRMEQRLLDRMRADG